MPSNIFRKLQNSFCYSFEIEFEVKFGNVGGGEKFSRSFAIPQHNACEVNRNIDNLNF